MTSRVHTQVQVWHTHKHAAARVISVVGFRAGPHNIVKTYTIYVRVVL